MNERITDINDLVVGSLYKHGDTIICYRGMESERPIFELLNNTGVLYMDEATGFMPLYTNTYWGYSGMLINMEIIKLNKSNINILETI
jgi:hypothetical protein